MSSEKLSTDHDSNDAETMVGLILRDVESMQRALTLAEASVGLASPNPQVGCVLVQDGVVLGEGVHRYDERDHAEIVALKQASAGGYETRGATAFVTLEPCSHQGRTGPCADALIAAGIARCYVATVDPNPAVSGGGIAKLRAAGVEVHVGLEQERARRLNEAFAESIVRGRPFVTLKAGLSIDGRLAPAAELRSGNAPFWLTGPESRAEVRRLRHASDAILTGIGTVLADDPLLTDRTGLPRRRPLMRVVLDSRLRTPASSGLVKNVQDDLWIFCGEEADPAAEAALKQRGVRITRVARDGRGLAMLAILQELQGARLLSVLLEGGSGVNGEFLRRNLVDRATLFYAPLELGVHSVAFASAGPTPFALEERMSAVTRRNFGADVCVSGLLHDPWASAPNIV